MVKKIQRNCVLKQYKRRKENKENKKIRETSPEESHRTKNWIITTTTNETENSPILINKIEQQKLLETIAYTLDSVSLLLE